MKNAYNTQFVRMLYAKVKIVLASLVSSDNSRLVVWSRNSRK